MTNEEFKSRRENLIKREGLAKLLTDLKPTILNSEGDKEYKARGVFYLSVGQVPISHQEIYKQLPFFASVGVYDEEFSRMVGENTESYLQLEEGQGNSYDEAYGNLLTNLGIRR